MRFARAMGADIVIAIDIYCQSPRAEGLAVPTVLSRVMQTQSCLVTAADMAEADVLIAPIVSAPSMSAKDSEERDPGWVRGRTRRAGKLAGREKEAL